MAGLSKSKKTSARPKPLLMKMNDLLAGKNSRRVIFLFYDRRLFIKDRPVIHFLSREALFPAVFFFKDKEERKQLLEKTKLLLRAPEELLNG